MFDDSLTARRCTLQRYAPWLLIAAWGVAMYAALRFAQVRGAWSDVLCGPWGCSAPLEALGACHAAWLLAIGPLNWLAGRRRSIRRQFTISVGLLLVGLGGLAVLAVGVVRDDSWSGGDAYLMQRIGLKLAGSTELPFVALFLAGVIGVSVIGWRKIFQRSGRTHPIVSETGGVSARTNRTVANPQS